MYRAAVSQEKKHGIPAPITTAQAILETGYGEYVPRDKYTGKYSYNLLGVKGKGTNGSVFINTKEDYGNGMVLIEDEFKAYHNYEESFEDRSKILIQYYKKYVKQNTIDGWIDALISGGYATDPNYKSYLLEIINMWGLK